MYSVSLQLKGFGLIYSFGWGGWTFCSATVVLLACLSPPHVLLSVGHSLKYTTIHCDSPLQFHPCCWGLRLQIISKVAFSFADGGCTEYWILDMRWQPAPLSNSTQNALCEVMQMMRLEISRCKLLGQLLSISFNIFQSDFLCSLIFVAHHDHHDWLSRVVGSFWQNCIEHTMRQGATRVAWVCEICCALILC